VGEEVEILKDHPDLLPNPLGSYLPLIHLDSVDEDAALVRFDEKVDTPEESALAGAARPDDDEGFSLRYLEGDSAEDMEGTKVLVDAL
jgi:hypothetical protein